MYTDGMLAQRAQHGLLAVYKIGLEYDKTNINV